MNSFPMTFYQQSRSTAICVRILILQRKFNFHNPCAQDIVLFISLSKLTVSYQLSEKPSQTDSF